MVAFVQKSYALSIVGQGLWGDFTAEGLVARPKTELFGRDGKRVITKIKYKDFSQNQ